MRDSLINILTHEFFFPFIFPHLSGSQSDKNFIDRFDQCTVASSDPGSEFNGGQINEFCKYVDRKCILPDGSPSPVLSGMHVSELPVSYLEFCKLFNEERYLFFLL